MIAPSYLAERHAVVKLGLVMALSLILFVAIDPVTPLLFLIGTVAAGISLGRIRPAAYLGVLGPLALVGLGFVWTNALFARTVDPAAPSWWIGPFRATLPGFLFGLAIGLRGLAVGALSVTFVLTTDPTDLVVGLIRRARVPFRIAYPMLAAYRFLPFFREELDQIDLARRVRGQALGGGPAEAAWRRLGEVIPLVSSAVRRASRIAVAMDARGFASAHERTYLREAKIGMGDAVMVAVALALAIGLMVLGAIVGWLRIWDGRFAA